MTIQASDDDSYADELANYSAARERPDLPATGCCGTG